MTELTAKRVILKDALDNYLIPYVDIAESAKKDESGNLITTTYATKTELNAKQATITGGATTITSSNLTASRALISNSSGKVAVSDITSTELSYLDNATSNIQAQLNTKIDKLDCSLIYPVIKEYVSGTSGYRIWSSGYCEQWGQFARSAASNTITLLKTYADTKYNIQISAYHTTLSTDGRPPLIYSTSTTASSFVFNLYTTYIGIYWKTSGYLASGEY